MNVRVLGCFGAIVLAGVSSAAANEPVASYIFPAGAQRGTKCDVRVGGLFLHDGCGIDLPTPGLRALAPLRRVPTIWFEGPLVPLPESQLAEDYPRDFATQIEIAADAPLGPGYWRLSTSQGATATRRFIVGDLPEIVEEEIDGEPIPVAVRLGVTINGRIFPREDVDLWTFEARRGQTVWAEVCAARLGSPLEARLEISDPSGRRLAESVGEAAREASLSFTAPADGTYTARIHDVNFGGLQNYVYRLTLGGGPHVTAVFPLGARRGSKTRFELRGAGLRDEPTEVAISTVETPTHMQRFDVAGQTTNAVPIELDDLAEQIEREPNNDAAQAETVAVPCIANGRIGAPADVDRFAFPAAKGQTFDFDLRASRLGSPLDGVLVVLDASGAELARSDDAAAGNTDSQCRFTAPADGTYQVRIEDRLPSRGGPTFAYRVRIDRAAPDFRLLLGSDALNLVRAQEAKLRVDVESLAPVEVPIELAVEGLPEGVTFAPTQIPAKAKQVELKFATPARIPVRTGRLRVRGTATIDGQEIKRLAMAGTRRGEPPLDHAFWAVAIPTPFKIVGTYKMSFEPRGGIVERHYRLVRDGYGGPLEVSLADRQLRHLQGVTGPTIAVPPGAEAFDYSVYLPPWMELGRTSRTCLMAEATTQDFDGSAHVVSFSTLEQNEQVVIRVSSSLLTLATDRESVLAQPGGKSTIRVDVTREPGHAAPVKVELVAPAHVRGVKAEPVVLGAAASTAPLVIEYARDCGVFNMPLVVRASSLDAERPAVAEVKLDIVAPR